MRWPPGNSAAQWIVGLQNNENISGVGLIERSRNTEGSLTEESRFGVSTRFTFHSDGATASRSSDKPATTNYSSYFRGVARTESRPEGVTITRAVNSDGTVSSETDGESTWGYSYDGIGRLTAIDFPIGSDATISWSTTSRTLTRGAYSETTQFDSFGRVTSVSREGVARTFRYDALGRKTFESLPGSSAGTTYTLDVLGRVKSESSPAGNKTYIYSSGNVSVTNERGYTTRYEYDRYGNPDEGHLTQIVAPVSAASISMGRNQIGVLQSASQGGVTRTYGRDSRFFLTSMTEPETGTTSFGRDGVGNMTSKTAGGQTVTYSYDGLNRLRTISGSGLATATIGYDRRGKVTSVNNSVAARTYDYDANGNLTLDRLSIDGSTFSVTYDYDSIDGLASITYPMSKGTVTYAPNGLGRPTRASPYLSSVSHHDSGNLSSVSYANGVTQSFGENSRQLPSSITAGSIQLGLSYAYDGAGNVDSINDSYASAENRNLGYDAVDRLTSASGPWGSGAIVYDGAGNIDRQTFGSYSINYNYSSNRLSSITGSRPMSFAYDGRGNITGNGTSTFTFDVASQLTCANCGTANEVTYQYDGQGRRVSEERSGRKTYFVQAPNGDLQFEYTPYGKLWTKNVFLHGKRVASESASDATVTTTSLSSSPSPASYGAAVTLTAVVSPSASGTVEFRDGDTVLGVAQVTGGSATLVVSSLSVGTHALRANYLGDANAQPSSGSGTLSVTTRSSTTSVTANPGSSGVGQAVVLNATVSGAGPTGQVRFSDNGAAIATVTLSSGSAQLTTQALVAGAHSILAEYLGDGNHAPSSATVPVTVSKAAPAVQLSSSLPVSTIGNNVTFTVTLVGTAGITPSGSVTFSDGGITLATVALANGGASYTTNMLQVGSHSIVVSYSGDSNFAAGSAGITQIVNPNAVTGYTLPPMLFDDPED